MHKNDILTLISYTFWADSRVLDACEALPVEDFTRVVSPDPGWHSLRGTIVHTIDTAYGWRTKLMDIKDTGVIDEALFADVASLRLRWEEEKTAWLAYVSTLNDAEINAVWWSQGNISRTRWQTMMHVVNDLTHHRSEAAAILTGFGHSPGELDFDQYIVDILPINKP